MGSRGGTGRAKPVPRGDDLWGLMCLQHRTLSAGQERAAHPRRPRGGQVLERRRAARRPPTEPPPTRAPPPGQAQPGGLRSEAGGFGLARTPAPPRPAPPPPASVLGARPMRLQSLLHRPRQPCAGSAAQLPRAKPSFSPPVSSPSLDHVPGPGTAPASAYETTKCWAVCVNACSRLGPKACVPPSGPSHACPREHTPGRAALAPSSPGLPTDPRLSPPGPSSPPGTRWPLPSGLSSGSTFSSLQAAVLPTGRGP